MSSSYPKLLIATEYAPNSPGGGFVIVRQMLRGWPLERIDWWSCRPAPAGDVKQTVSRLATASLPPKLYPNRRFGRIRGALMERFWAPYASSHLRRTIREFQPDVIWGIPQGYAIPPLADVLLGGQVPFHVTMHDYPDLENTVKRIGAAQARSLAKRADALYAGATSRDAISTPMLNELRRTTGADGFLCRLGVEVEDLAYVEQKRPRPAGEIRIGFAGSVTSERTFELFVRALAGIRERLPSRVTLEFFGSNCYEDRRWFDTSWMKSHGHMSEADCLAALRQFSWGLLALASTDDDPRYHRFSFPAKVSSYLAAGLPIIALIHPESSVMDVASKYEIGICSTASSLEELQAKLLPALSAGDPWARYADGIRQCIRSEFNAAKMREDLHRCFVNSAARKSRP
jgi:hypothetical protein